MPHYQVQALIEQIAPLQARENFRLSEVFAMGAGTLTDSDAVNRVVERWQEAIEGREAMAERKRAEQRQKYRDGLERLRQMFNIARKDPLRS